MSLPQNQSVFVNINASATAGTSVASTGDKAVWAPPVPVNIVRWGFIIAGTALPVDQGVLALDKQPTAGSASGRVDAYGGTITVAAVTALGTVCYNEPTEVLPVMPGEAVVFEVTDAWSAGVVTFFVEYRPLPFIDADLSHVQAFTA